MTPTTQQRVEPMTAERLGDIRSWFNSHNPGEISQKFGREILAEVDRLRADLAGTSAIIADLKSARDTAEKRCVEMGAELVTLRAEHAQTERSRDGWAESAKTYAANADHWYERAKQAERRLAVAVEALKSRPKFFVNGYHEERVNHGYGAFDRRCKEALAAISSDAPAKDDTGPASKPLVVGFKVGDLLQNKNWVTRSGKFWVTPHNVNHVTANAELYERVEPEPGQSLPSTKADEGKAKSTMQAICTGTLPTDSTDPTPPALTREEVAAIADKVARELVLKHVSIEILDGDSIGVNIRTPQHNRNLKLASIFDLAAFALSDGGAK